MRSAGVTVEAGAARMHRGRPARSTVVHTDIQAMRALGVSMVLPSAK
jgi:hypothetical protein